MICGSKLLMVASALFLVALLGCQDPEVSGIDLQPLAVRLEVAEGTVGAISYKDEAGKAWFGPPHHFGVDNAREEDGPRGERVILFQVVETEAEKFSRLTKECVDRRMAFAVEGVIYSAPYINEPLADVGIILHGEDGFDEEEMELLLHILNRQSSDKCLK